MTPNIMINQTDNSPPKRWLRPNNLIQIVKPGEIFSNRDCWIRTNDPMVPNHVLYQTELNPDIKIGVGLNFYRHPHLNNRYSVTNVGNQYSQRSTVSWLWPHLRGCFYRQVDFIWLSLAQSYSVFRHINHISSFGLGFRLKFPNRSLTRFPGRL